MVTSFLASTVVTEFNNNNNKLIGIGISRDKIVIKKQTEKVLEYRDRTI